ncbi:MAG: DUF6448 family protein [Candidatus Micrarchaeota archaeon]
MGDEMPPHCDTLDGPVVKAAMKALEKGNVNLVLPWVHEGAEGEVRAAFGKAMKARKQGADAAEVADLWFFETVVRLHRAGEGAPYNGLKPAGLDTGPVIPRAESAIGTGNCGEVTSLLSNAVKEEVEGRFAEAMEKRDYDADDVRAARAYVDAMLDFLLYSHHTYMKIRGGAAHGEGKGGHAD